MTLSWQQVLSHKYQYKCQTLIITLSRGPARQPDSVCISIWSHLSSISITSSIHIQWIPSYIGILGNTLADLEAKRGLHPSSDTSSCRSGNGKGPDPEDGTGGVSDLLQTRPALSHSPHLHWRYQPAGTLEIWLDQKSVHHCCPVEDRPQSASGQLPPPHRTTTVSSVSVLRRRLSIFYFAVRHTRRHVPLPTTSTQLILDACGPFWSRSGP